jgi:hypothetical protein
MVQSPEKVSLNGCILDVSLDEEFQVAYRSIPKLLPLPVFRLLLLEVSNLCNHPSFLGEIGVGCFGSFVLSKFGGLVLLSEIEGTEKSAFVKVT